MSFQRSSDLESQPTNWRREDDPAYADDPEFTRFTGELADRIFSLTSNVSGLSTQVGLLGTKRETERVRERVRDMIEEGNSKFKEVGEGLKKVISWEDVGVCYYSFLRSRTRYEELQKLINTTASPTIHPIKTKPRIPSLPPRIPRPPTHSSRERASLRRRRSRCSRRIRLLTNSSIRFRIRTPTAATRTRTAPSRIPRRSRLPRITHHRTGKRD